MSNPSLVLLIASSLFLYASPAFAGPNTDMKDGVAQGRSALVEQAIQNGADVNFEMNFGSHTDYVLPWAASNNNLKLVMLLVEKGAKVDQAGYNGRALPHAIRLGNYAMVKYLVEHKAVVDQDNLLMAASNKNAETQAVFNYLLTLENKQPLIAKAPIEILTNLIEKGHTENLRYFLKLVNVAKIEDKVWSELLPKAAASSEPLKLSLMLEQVGVSHFSQASLAECLQLSVGDNQLESVQILLKFAGDKLGQQGLEEAYLSAANKGYGNILKILAAYNGQIKITKATQEKAFIQAVAGGLLNLAGELHQQVGSAGFQPETWRQALVAAASLDTADGLKWLQNMGGKYFDMGAYSQALVAAGKAWKTNNLIWILDQQKGQWGTDILAETLSQAVTAEHLPNGVDNPLYQALLSPLFREGKSPLAKHSKVIQLVLPDNNQPILDGPLGVELVKTLMAYGFNLNQQNKDGKTLVMLYSQNEINYSDLRINDPWVMLEFLISQKGRNVNLLDKEGRNELMYVLGNDDPKIASHLLSQGANLNHTDKNGFGALYYFLRDSNRFETQNSLERLNWLLAQGLRDNTPLDKLLDPESLTPEMLLFILKNKLGANYFQYRDNNGRTLLQIFLEYPYVSEFQAEIKKLLACKVDVNAKDKNGMTPWLAVTSKGHAEKLLSKGAILNSTLPDGRSLLHLALEKVAEFEVNWDKGYSNETDSHEALELAVFLVQKGANGLLADKKGHRPMDLLLDSLVLNVPKVEGWEESRSFDHIFGKTLWPLYRELIALLLSQGAVMAPNHDQTMALFKVSLYGDMKFLPWFKTSFVQGHFKIEMRESANPVYGADEYNRTLLLVAADSDNTEIVDYLLSQGADINAQDAIGKTPLITAVKFKCIRVLKRLLQNKPRLDIKDKQGLTALGWAIKLDDDEMIKILKAAGATS